MDNINAFSGENLAGFELLEFAPVDNISDIPDQKDGEITSAISFLVISQMYTIYAKKGSIQFEEQSSSDKAGNYFNVTVRCVVPKLTSTQLANLQSMERRLYVVKAKDNNGTYRLIGTLEEPLRFKYNPAQRENPGDVAGFTLEFFGKLSSSAPFYNV